MLFWTKHERKSCCLQKILLSGKYPKMTPTYNFNSSHGLDPCIKEKITPGQPGLSTPDKAAIS